MKKVLSIILCMIMVISSATLVSANAQTVSKLEDIDWSKAIDVDNMEYNNGDEYCSFVTFAIKDNIIYKIEVESDISFEKSLEKYKNSGYAPSCVAVAYLTDKTQKFEIAEEVNFPSLDNLPSKVSSAQVFEYNVSPSKAPNTIANVSKLTGYDFTEIDRNKIEEITIPDTVEEISDFKNLENLKTLKIGKSVKTVKEATFFGSSKLENIIVDEENEFLEARDSRIIDKVTNTQLFDFKPQEVYLVKNDVDSIRLDFVENSVKSIIVGHTIKEMYNDDYYKNNNIEEIVFVNKAKVTDNFDVHCNKLENVTFSKNQKITGKIRSNKLTEIEFKKGLKVINESAFSYCKNLKKIVINNTKTAPKIERNYSVFSSKRNKKSPMKIYVKNKRVAKDLKAKLDKVELFSIKNKYKIYIGTKLYK